MPKAINAGDPNYTGTLVKSLTLSELKPLSHRALEPRALEPQALEPQALEPQAFEPQSP